ncbi:MAG TPA: hypothetical protein IGR64_09930 [Leptolyngbyaceae cyanobacterium M65_K2018_010]|nr:hypothetical protein [Leptolyngbyaceae cyanobacterium M65_K2018_010]
MRSPTTITPLQAFLRQPNIEGSPAWEFVNGRAQQQPMPTLFHAMARQR